VESEIETILVLSGVTAMNDIPQFPYKPKHILEGIFEIPGSFEIPGRHGSPEA
jgi:NagD protein